MNILSGLRPKQWNLIISPPRKRMLIALGYLAHQADLVVLDCGRQFDSSVIARAAKGRQEIIDRIKTQRAFICTEAVKLLERTPARTTPIVILDFLSTFYDENVRLAERRFLLENSIRHFQRLTQFTGLAVSVYPPPASSDGVLLFERLKSVAPQVSIYEPMPRADEQWKLF